MKVADYLKISGRQENDVVRFADLRALVDEEAQEAPGADEKKPEEKKPDAPTA